MGRIDYEIEMSQRHKNFVHVNLLKCWHAPLVAFAETEVKDPDDLANVLPPCDQHLPAFVSEGPTIDRNLSSSQQQDLQDLLEEFQDIISETPGRTEFAIHSIQTGDPPPVRQRPYHLPYSRREIFCNDLEKMLNMNVIQPSDSPWASPIVLDAKKDSALYDFVLTTELSNGWLTLMLTLCHVWMNFLTRSVQQGTSACLI